MSTHTAAHCSTLRDCIHRRRLQKSSKHTAAIIISSFLSYKPRSEIGYVVLVNVTGTIVMVSYRQSSQCNSYEDRVPDLQMSSNDLTWVLGYQANGYQATSPNGQRHIHNLPIFMNINTYWIYCHRHTPWYATTSTYLTCSKANLHSRSDCPPTVHVTTVNAEIIQTSQNKTTTETSTNCHQKSYLTFKQLGHLFQNVI